jgi:translation initiation factor 1
MNSRPAGSVLVYSTDGGRVCPGCGCLIAACRCKAATPSVAAPGKTRVLLENKGRGGKSVTVVRGLPLAADGLAVLARDLRAACGSGGTVKDGVVEVQGDQRGKVTAFLVQRGLLRPAR